MKTVWTICLNCKEPRPMKRYILGAVVAAALLLAAFPAVAQTTVTEPITGVRITVIPATGDPATITAVRSADVMLSAASPMCNQPQVTGTQPSSVTNPVNVWFDDPYHAGMDCKVPFGMTGLPEGSYRAVAQFLTAAASCDVGGVTRTPCISDRSAVAIPPFIIQNTRVAPGVPTGVILTR